MIGIHFFVLNFEHKELILTNASPILSFSLYETKYENFKSPLIVNIGIIIGLISSIVCSTMLPRPILSKCDSIFV